MKNKFLSLSITLILLVIFFIFYKGLQGSNIYTPNLNIQKNVPSFKAKLFDSSDEIKSEEIFNRNDFYLVNIWASWCIPCRDEHPFLMELSKNKKLKLIGLNYKDSVKNAKIFLSEYENPYDVILQDNDGIIAIEWGAYGIPETFIVSKNKILKRIIGPIDKITFLEIKKIIK